MRNAALGCIVFLMAAVVQCFAQESAYDLRTWTDKSGNAVAAQFIKVERGIVYLNDAAGKKITINVRELSDVDAEYVKTVQSAATASTPKTQALSAGMKELLGPQLINSKGTRVSTDTLGGKFVGLYFSNQYQSSRMTVFRLIDFYTGVLQRKDPFEVVFVSSDRTEEAMRSYMSSAQMPWLAVPLNSDICGKLNTRFIGANFSNYGYYSGPPMFVVIAPDGQVVTHNGFSDVMNDPMGSFTSWSSRYNSQKVAVANRSVGVAGVPARNASVGMSSAISTVAPPPSVAGGFGQPVAAPKPSAPEYEVRLWTDRRGQTIQARFVRLDKGTLYLLDTGGTEIAVVLNELSPADLDYVIKTQAAAKSSLAPMNAELKALLGTELVNAKGAKVPVDSLGGKIVGLYFSAHWCPPCRTFTPRLIEFYNTLAEKKAPFEIVFVSADQTAEAMRGYMSELNMPWVAIPWQGEAVNRLNERFSVNGIPTLIILSADGKVISRAGRRDVMSDPTGAFDSWRLNASFN